MHEYYIGDLVIFFYMQRTISGSDSNMTLTEFGHKCQKAALHTFMDETKSAFTSQPGNFDVCVWFTNMLQEQELQEKCSQLAKGRFGRCKTDCN